MPGDVAGCVDLVGAGDVSVRFDGEIQRTYEIARGHVDGFDGGFVAFGSCVCDVCGVVMVGWMEQSR